MKGPRSLFAVKLRGIPPEGGWRVHELADWPESQIVR
jgi:hypothetical protein